MRLRKTLVFVVAGASLALLAAPASAAAFNPTTHFALSTTAVKANPAVTITVGQSGGQNDIKTAVLSVPAGFKIPADAAINNGTTIGSGSIKVATEPTCTTASQVSDTATVTEKDRTAAQKSAGDYAVWHVDIHSVVTFDVVWKGSVTNGFKGHVSVPSTPATCPPFTLKITINKKAGSTTTSIFTNPRNPGTYTFKIAYTSTANEKNTDSQKISIS